MRKKGVIGRLLAVLALLGTTASCADAAEPFEVAVEPGRDTYTIKAPKSGCYRLEAEAESKVPVGQRHFIKLRWEGGVLQTRRLLEYNKTKALMPLDRVVLRADEPRKLTIAYDESQSTVTKLVFRPEKTDPVPPEAQRYRPPLRPPARHPRVMVDPASLAKIRANLEVGENRAVWEHISDIARKPYTFKREPDAELLPDDEVVYAAAAKAFYYLMTGDRNVGADAVKLMRAYLQNVSFGNGEGSCRQVGEALYGASLVYDWCYPLLTPEDRKIFHDRMLFFAVDMEIGWPPFKQSAGAGHGNEAQVSRDLLAMAIALYDEDPTPFRWVCYQMLENMKPLKQFIYPSGRHDQGTFYGQYRLGWDLYAALQFRRTFGVELLPPETARLPYYWRYLRTPDGRLLPEGDGGWIWNGQYKPLKEAVPMLANALYPDPEVKAETYREAPPRTTELQLLFLLTNDPNQAPEDRRAAQPLTRIYRMPLPGMALRTGWNFGQDADDAVITMNGAGYHFRNHQHLDMGGFQIYYRGNLAAELSQYKIYGVPYDFKIAKRASLHSMMRFVDPDQKTWLMGDRFALNTGGPEVETWTAPPDIRTVRKNKDRYCVGGLFRAGSGPDAVRPVYSFFETDLTKPYAGRVKAYTRSFVFLNQERADRPGTLLILDRFTTAKPAVRPIFQLTSIDRPAWKGDHLELRTALYGKVGQLTLTPLLPARVEAAVLTARDAHTFEGVYIEPRIPARPEANGSRTELTGAGGVYLNALQLHDGALTALPVTAKEHGNRVSVSLDRTAPEADAYLTDLGSLLTPTRAPFSVTVPADRTRVLVLDLAPGPWRVTGPGIDGAASVTAEGGQLFLRLDRGEYRFAPGTAEKPLPVPAIEAAGTRSWRCL